MTDIPVRDDSVSVPDFRSQLWHLRVRDFEWFDRVTMEVVPRYKTSGMSGDEWRQHGEVVCTFKGFEVLRFGARDMTAAMAMLPGKAIARGDEGVDNGFIARERATCDQPSCQNEPVVWLKPKRLTARDGSYLDMADQHLQHYRQFCSTHKTRGDCAREDADENYETIPDPRKVKP